jgi:polynucleotide 5'-hydroxyl-kinase GRC3/NOL9
MNDCEVPEVWREALGALAEGPRQALVVGATDAGKSTFCRWLAEVWGVETWLIDADVGQSQLGPPATIGCGKAGGGRMTTEAAFFVGDVSPVTSAAAGLGAFARAVRAVREAGAARVVIDTTGWVSGADAVALKLAQGNILGSAHVMLIERASELRAFRRAWRGLPDFPLHVLPPAAAARARSPGERRAFRETAFRAALAGAVECELDLREVAVSGVGELETPLPALPPGQLLGLNDARGRLICLGVLLHLEPQAGRLTCLCRPAGADAAEVRVGRIFLQPDGTHSSRISLTQDTDS